jgi:CO/xanthine dehydrogenase FAD-binding subunit
MEYIRPQTIKDVLQSLKKWKEKAELVAGGTNIVPDLRDKKVRREILVDLSRVKGLSYIKEEGQKIRIGALTTFSEICSSKVLRTHAAILSEAARQIGNPLVRNRATMAGNLADASPAADMAPPLLALEALVGVEKEGGKIRQVPIDQFFAGPNRTILRKDEMIREIVIPRPKSSAKTAYIKLGLRNAMAISVISIAVLAEIEKGMCKKARVGLGAVAPTPVRAYGVEGILAGHEMTEERIMECCERVQTEIFPITDIRASRQYRSSMASVFLGRLLQGISGKK